MLRFVLAFMLCATAAFAGSHNPENNWPALYDVTDVASDDVLNIRQQPSSKAPIISALAYDQTYVEILEVTEDGRWGLVRGSEAGMGWVFMRYMQAIPGGFWPEWPHMVCSGSEYSWRFRFTQGGTGVYTQSFGEPEVPLNAGLLRSGGEHLFARGIMASGAGTTVTASVEAAQCTSTMIDAEFGLRAGVWAITPDGTRFHNGCCVLVSPQQ